MYLLVTLYTPSWCLPFVRIGCGNIRSRTLCGTTLDSVLCQTLGKTKYSHPFYCCTGDPSQFPVLLVNITWGYTERPLSLLLPVLV